MRTFSARRWTNIGIAAMLGLVVVAVWWICRAAPQRPAALTGWTLLGMIVVLLAYNIRKRLPFLPLASSATWLQWHLYIGWLAILLFLVHVDFSRPTGGFETALTIVFGIVAVSGIIGIWISRVLPRRLTTHGEPVLYERIGTHRRAIRERAELLIVQVVAESQATTIADYYGTRLAAFFDRPRHFWSHMLGSIAPQHQLRRELNALRRYLDDCERKALIELDELVRVKDDLDFQYAAQSVLKWWLFVHVPLAYALLIMALVHLAMVYAFAGGGR